MSVCEDGSGWRVAVAVSGGADSLHALKTLKAAGAEVIALHGLFLRLDTNAEKDALAMRERMADACAELDVQLHVADLRDQFDSLVVRPFVESYAAGLTPNPCALCNARVKFGLLLEQALALGMERIATGHYARLLRADAGRTGLLQGEDPAKDQSYFLSLVPETALARAYFPLGKARKADILRELAGQGITPPQPKESQEVCFVPDDAYREFIPGTAKRLGITLPGPGPMLLQDGTRLGTHKGLWQYTEGQRRGLGIGWKEPLHVLAKERDANVLRLGPRPAMRGLGCVCRDVNILLPPDLWPENVWVKTRYREKPKQASVTVHEDGREGWGMIVRFAEPDSVVAPGQIATVYIPWSTDDGAESLRVVAGGVIEAGL